jgi:hypothetical protein
MMRNLLMFLGLAVGVGLAPAQVLAQAPIRGPVEMRTSKSLTEITEHVDTIDRRLQKGRYDTLSKKDQAWIVKQINDLRTELKLADITEGPSSELQVMAGEFELGMIKIEEGGIVCRKEARTGSRMREDKCYTYKRLQEDTDRSRENLRRLRRPQSLPPGG